MTKFIKSVKSFAANESGAVASEYAVLLVLIAAALVTMVLFLSDTIGNALHSVASTLITDGGVTAPVGNPDPGLN